MEQSDHWFIFLHCDGKVIKTKIIVRNINVYNPFLDGVTHPLRMSVINSISSISTGFHYCKP
jgi:hypothetical protein